MEKKPFKKVYVLGLVGAILWSMTVLLRDTSIVNNSIIKQILFVTPNIGASLVVFYLIDKYYSVITKKDYTLKMSLITLGMILFLAIGSEIYHDLFLNAPYDIADILATVITVVILGLIVVKDSKKAIDDK
ncbi:MAG: hypothetical protein JEZ08_04225 [Clostridiales bacterium]|nr:hypothetical protein [Clostridiales bacterium]